MKTDELKKLHQKKYRQQFGFFLAEGEHLVQELQRATHSNPALLESELYLAGKYEDWPSVLPRHVVSDKLMAQLSDTPSPQGIVACIPMAAVLEHGAASDAGERGVYLHELQDPGNLGTILRTLAWFGGFRCLLSPGSVDPFNSKVVRASMGAIFHVPLETEVTTAALLSRYGQIACLDMKGESLQSADFHLSECLAFGSESRGLPAELLQQAGGRTFSIPGSGQIDSLNVASTVNMCIYELRR
ncbi:MAG: RNA methyltransferase [Gammaproteobacteria bacterium]|nr:RNA methyltransferase [Gammaproteobacteria bacterium]